MRRSKHRSKRYRAIETERRKRRLEAWRARRFRPVIAKTAKVYIGDAEMPATLIEIGVPKL